MNQDSIVVGRSQLRWLVEHQSRVPESLVLTLTI